MQSKPTVKSPPKSIGETISASAGVGAGGRPPTRSALAVQLQLWRIHVQSLSAVAS